MGESSMMTRRGLTGVLLCAGVLVLGGCGGTAKSSSVEVRYRVKLSVETPQGEKTGSSVWSFTLIQPTLALGSPYDAKYAGEAVAVDLPGGQTLFALVKDQEMLPERHFDDHNAGKGQDRMANLRNISSAREAEVTLPCKTPPENADDNVRRQPEYDCPMLVTFKDITDPTSVVRVDPDDLAATFGKGYSLKAITVQITDAPVTTGIEKRLPDTFWQAWGLIHKQEMSQEGGIMKNPYFESLAGQLSKNDFVTGVR
jgi:hypothetical protein